MVTTNSDKLNQQLVDYLEAKYSVYDLCDAKRILGWTILQDRKQKTLFVTQPQLAQDLATLLQMTHAKCTPTHYLSGIKTHTERENETNLLPNCQYERAVGMLQYMVDSIQIDLTYVVNALDRH